MAASGLLINGACFVEFGAGKVFHLSVSFSVIAPDV